MVNLILDMFPDRVNSQDKQDIFTPHRIAKDMIYKMPKDMFTHTNTFLDPYCKSGVFLENIYQRLMQSPDLVSRFSDRFERHKYILKNQIFGISPTEQCRAISIRTVYGNINVENNIICLGNKYLSIIKNKDKQFLYKTLEREFGRMKFNVVALNPPYNKGKDIDFINTAYELSTDYVIAITPAKWQTAKADHFISSKMSYGEFREKIVPHMRHVCFYPDCLDVFGIAESSGISWYIIDKNRTYINNCTIENKCSLQQLINSETIRDITKQQSLWNIGNTIYSFIHKHIDFKSLNIERVDTCKEYCVLMNTQGLKQLGQSGAYDWTNNKIDLSYVGKGGVAFDKDGRASVIGTIYKTNLKGGYRPKEETKEKITIFTSDSEQECESYISYINSKIIRFMVFINISSMRTANNESFRLAPNPPSGKFDHIYTDEELYKAFNLPQEYIDVIEAIIK